MKHFYTEVVNDRADKATKVGDEPGNPEEVVKGQKGLVPRSTELRKHREQTAANEMTIREVIIKEIDQKPRPFLYT